MLATILLSQLSINVIRHRRIFLSINRINEMHYPFQVSRRQVCLVSWPWFPVQRICRKILHSASFFSLYMKTNRFQWIPCLHLLVWFYAETRKKNSLDHCWIEMFLNLSTTIKSSALAKSILDLLARETCLARKWKHKRALIQCSLTHIFLQQLHY